MPPPAVTVNTSKWSWRCGGNPPPAGSSIRNSAASSAPRAGAANEVTAFPPISKVGMIGGALDGHAWLLAERRRRIISAVRPPGLR